MHWQPVWGLSIWKLSYKASVFEVFWQFRPACVPVIKMRLQLWHSGPGEAQALLGSQMTRRCLPLKWELWRWAWHQRFLKARARVAARRQSSSSARCVDMRVHRHSNHYFATNSELKPLLAQHFSAVSAELAMPSPPLYTMCFSFCSGYLPCVIHRTDLSQSDRFTWETIMSYLGWSQAVTVCLSCLPLPTCCFFHQN